MSTGYDDMYQLGQQLGMRRGLFGGAQVPTYQTDLNFMNAGMGGAFGGVASMIVPPLVNQMFGQSGIMPAQFMPQQSLYEQYRAKQYFQSHQAAMATAAQADRETYVRVIRGIAQARGTPWGLDQQRSANVMAGDMAFMAPFMAQAFPEVFDEMHGTRGSATVMASFLHRGGLTGVDPVTGRTGVSGVSAGILANEMHRRFFGVDADLAGWRGVSAGRAGAMYDELQTRGLMGMSIGAMTPAEQVTAMAGSATSRQDAMRLLQARAPAQFADIVSKTGVTDVTRLAEMPGIAADALKNLQTTDRTQYDTLLRQFDATQIGNRLKTMSGAVTAMREIFGDMGQPNAPMSQLIEGLNQLTQGGLATMNPAELERSVRTMQVTARSSGMGMAGLVGLTTTSADMATRMGLDPRFGMLAAQGAAEFGAAFGQVGRGDLAGWGRVDRDKLTMMDAQLRLRAANSPMANQLGAAMRMVETQEGAGIPVTGPLAAVAAAVRTHSDTFTNELGKQESLNMTEQRFRELAAMSNFDPSTTMAFLRSQAANQEQIARYGAGDIARRAQPDEIRRLMAESFHETALGRLERAGVTDPARRREIADTVANAQAQAMLNMPEATRLNDATRNQYLMDVTRTAVLAMPGMNAAEFERMFPREQFAAMVAGGVGRIEQRRASDPRLQGYVSMNAMLDAQNRRVLDRQTILRQENAAEVAIGTALGGLGTAGPLARIMDELQDPSKDIGTAIKKALGGVDPEQVRLRLANIDPNDLRAQAGIGADERLGVMMEELMKTSREYEDVRTGAMTPADKARRQAELTTRINALRAGGGAAGAEIRTELAKLNLVAADADPATVRAMAEKVRRGDVAVDEKVKNRIIALTAAGGATDEAAIERQQTAILVREGIKPEDMARARAGELDSKLSLRAREDLKTLGLMRSGVAGAAAEAGMNLGAQVSEKGLADVVAQQGYMAADLAKALPAGGPELKAAIAERERHATNVRGRGRDQLNALLGDIASMKNLGAGGFEMAKGAHEKQQDMARIAAMNGLDLTKVLAGTLGDETKLSPDQQKAIAQIRGLSGEVNETFDKMAKQMGGKHAAMTDAEVKAFEAYKATQTQSDAEKNKQLVSTVMGRGGSDTERAAIEKALGEGPEGEVRRYDLRKRAEAKTELERMAKERGISVADIRKEVEGGSAIARAFGMGKLWNVDADKAAELLATTGRRITEGDTAADVLSTIQEGNEQRAAVKSETDSKVAAGVGGKIAMSGVVKFIAPDGLDMSGATGTSMGSTPTRA